MARVRGLKFLLVASLFAAVVLPTLSAASAQGIFDFLFGHFGHLRRAPGAPPGYGYAPPQPMPPTERRSGRRFAQQGAYCVRLCDGSHFPLEARAETSPAELCHTLCPASKTAAFFGDHIDSAAAADGKRYSDLETAFAYRQRVVPQCTCNGKDPFGIARIPIDKDPTLQPGDMVATAHGILAFTGAESRKGEAKNFTPVEHYVGLPRDVRRRLANVTVRRGQ